MKFKGNGVVWDKSKKKRLCKFVDGVVDVDERAGKILSDQGFEQIDVGEDYTKIDSEVLTESKETTEKKTIIEIPTDWKLLQEKAKELKISIYGKNAKELTQLVKEKLEG